MNKNGDQKYMYMQQLRKMAITVLDDENGINEAGYDLLATILVQTDNADILAQVDVAEGRAYIGEDFAEEELSKIANKESDEVEAPAEEDLSNDAPSE